VRGPPEIQGPVHAIIAILQVKKRLYRVGRKRVGLENLRSILKMKVHTNAAESIPTRCGERF